MARQGDALIYSLVYFTQNQLGSEATVLLHTMFTGSHADVSAQPHQWLHQATEPLDIRLQLRPVPANELLSFSERFSTNAVALRAGC